MKQIKGYKVFNPDWTCKGFQYKSGETYSEDVNLKLCEKGFQFCEKLSDCFSHISFNSGNRVAEVVAIGKVVRRYNMCFTNKIKIGKELTWNEVLEMANEGKGCTGLWNTGDFNTGDWNTGNRNTGGCNTGDWNTGNCNAGNGNNGYRNTGSCNIGDRNTGDRNIGDRNTGLCNTGDRNTGDRNTGDFNTGDWNIGDRNTGCFMTEEQNIMLFDKSSDMTYSEWFNSDAHDLLKTIPKKVVEWIDSEYMTDYEKKNNPTYDCTGGYLKVLDESECAQIWWDGLKKREKDVIKSIPNFDSDIFKKCTGITV